MARSIEALRKEVLAANLAIFERGLARFTFGNVSGIDRERGVVVIKPSGVPYGSLTAKMLVACDLDGTLAKGALRPSSDLPTHLVLYRAFAGIGGIVHTHSEAAVSWAQAGRDIPCFGTTHADHFHGPVPVTAEMTPKEIAGDYEANTGHVIVQRFRGMDPLTTPAVLVRSHASFCWGTTVEKAVENADVLETVARMARDTVALNPKARPISQTLLNRHFLRKHGTAAYYGQPER
jgi:L-ribulose-5-phosphate 4-epimerase